MIKKQKVWLWIFVGMFILPEILWSTISNFIYELSQTSKSGGVHPYRVTFLENQNFLSGIVLFIQALGLLLTAIYLFRINMIYKKSYIWLLSIFLIIASIVVFYLSLFALTFKGIG